MAITSALVDILLVCAIAKKDVIAACFVVSAAWLNIGPVSKVVVPISHLGSSCPHKTFFRALCLLCVAVRSVSG